MNNNSEKKAMDAIINRLLPVVVQEIERRRTVHLAAVLERVAETTGNGLRGRRGPASAAYVDGLLDGLRIAASYLRDAATEDQQGKPW